MVRHLLTLHQRLSCYQSHSVMVLWDEVEGLVVVLIKLSFTDDLRDLFLNLFKASAQMHFKARYPIAGRVSKFALSEYLASP